MIAALVATLAVALSAPAGFVDRPALASRAATVAGKPVTVSCARDDASWSAATSDRSARAGSDVLAYVDAVGGSTISLSPTVCVPLLAKVNGKLVKWVEFGAALEVLAHEAEHIRGSADEGLTECAALAALPAFARASFGIRKAATMNLVMRGAWSRHHDAVRASPAYAGPCD